MPGPAALIALAARLGIPKGAKIIAEKGFKYLQKLVTKAEKQITKQQKTAGKGHKGKGSERKYPQQITKRTDSPPTKAQIEATKERNKTEWQRRAMDRGPGDLSIKKIKK